ncbi:MAG: hypothetical protein ACK4ZJ_17330, partial [Allorhizobium sp.]
PPPPPPPTLPQPRVGAPLAGAQAAAAHACPVVQRGDAGGVEDVGEEKGDDSKQSEEGGVVTVEWLMKEAYGKLTKQLGHRTDGHQCITIRDREEALAAHSSLLYGEVLPAGVDKLLDEHHLDAADASVLYDLGMGTGKLALQGTLRCCSIALSLSLSRARVCVCVCVCVCVRPLLTRVQPSCSSPT